MLKLHIHLELYKKAKSDEERKKPMLTIELYADKSRKLLVKIANTHHPPVTLMIALAFIDVLKQAFEGIVTFIEQVLTS